MEKTGIKSGKLPANSIVFTRVFPHHRVCNSVNSEANQQAYVVAVRRNGRAGIEWHEQPWPLSVSEVIDLVEPSAWQRLSAGEGAKGPRMYDWVLMELAESTAEEWPRQLLLRRSLADETEIAAYRTFAPADTPLSEFVRVAGTRWAIEDSIESAKGEVGLDQYEVRCWISWYRHITLALLAHAYLTVTRTQAAEQEQKRGDTAVTQDLPIAGRELLPLTVPEVRR
jgi:SRSO17 transposase